MSGGPIIRSAPSEKFTSNWGKAFAKKKPTQAAVKVAVKKKPAPAKAKAKGKAGKKKS